MATNINTLKNWFKTNLKPTQSQFWSWLDSYWHKDEQIPIAQIEDISNILNDKADAQALTNHLTDANAHANEFSNKMDKDGAKVLTDVNFSQEDKDKLDAQDPTVTPDTGDTVDLSNPLGNACNMASANGNASFITENEVPLGGALVLINRATEPTVFDSNSVAGTKLLGADFIALTEMYLAIWSNGERVDYKLIQIAE